MPMNPHHQMSGFPHPFWNITNFTDSQKGLAQTGMEHNFKEIANKERISIIPKKISFNCEKIWLVLEKILKIKNKN